MSLPAPDPAPITHRCFVSAIEVEKPEVNRFGSVVTLRADNGTLVTRMPVKHGERYYIGQVIWVTIKEGDL